HRPDEIGGDAVVAGTNEILDRRGAEPLTLQLADVLDRDAVALRALDDVERELVEAFALQVADVLRSDVVDRELKAPPLRKIFGVAERSHFSGVGGARGEGEEARAAAVAERAVERERAGLAPQLELDVRDRELIVVAGQAADIVDRKALAHVPIAV